MNNLRQFGPNQFLGTNLLWICPLCMYLCVSIMLTVDLKQWLNECVILPLACFHNMWVRHLRIRLGMCIHAFQDSSIYMWPGNITYKHTGV